MGLIFFIGEFVSLCYFFLLLLFINIYLFIYLGGGGAEQVILYISLNEFI